jgi:hypothetical protein
MPPPPDGDPRWSLAFAGGALMDVGCYGPHAHRMPGKRAGGEPGVGAENSATSCDLHIFVYESAEPVST